MEKDITNLKINMAKVETRLGGIEKKLDTHIEDQKEFIEKIEAMWETSLSGKANKWVEVTFTRILYSIVGVAIPGLAWLVYQAIVHFN